MVKVFAGVPDPKRVILGMLVRLTADNALKALRNEALLRDVADVYLPERG